ncbi:MAG: PBECR4 domain-containing protein [Lachnospiraceae bacterium]
MDKIYEAAAKYVALEQFEYEFILSHNRRRKRILVDFKDEDFFHLTGMQYLTDIDVPRNKKKVLDAILIKKIISDQILQKSKFFHHPKHDKDIKNRIIELCFLEEYLDNQNIIRIFTTRNQKGFCSQINAEYMIESQLHGSSDKVYIFLKQRENNPEYYCVISFFKKDRITYGGDILYWMQKKKICIVNQTEKILYQHPNYHA